MREGSRVSLKVALLAFFMIIDTIKTPLLCLALMIGMSSGGQNTMRSLLNLLIS